MHSLKRALAQFIRFPVNPRPVHRLKLNTLLRLTFILLLSSAGLTACANLQKEQTAHKQENDVTFSFAERLKTKAEQGDVVAQRLLGWYYEEGRHGLPQDYEKAAFWYRLAAEQGDALGQVALGMMYEEGRGASQDDRLAVEWYGKAAEQGDASGQFNLGWMYEKGRGAPRDDQLAVQWFRKAAEQGNAPGQFALGLMYKEGRGAPRDDQLAVQWFRKAAEQGNANGQFFVGVMYKEGRGVPKNYVYAYMWVDIAASNGFEKAVEPQNILEKEMTPSQIQKAKELARACERKQYKDCEV